MTNYSQRLQDYNRYNRIPQTIKLAKYHNGGWWGSDQDAGYLDEDDAAWTDDQAYQALLGSLPQEVQKEYLETSTHPGALDLAIVAMREPEKYRDALGYIVQSEQLKTQGRRSALLSSNIGQQIDRFIGPQIAANKKLQAYNKWLPGSIVSKSQGGAAMVSSINDVKNGLVQTKPGAQQTNQNQQTDQQQQNPSMWGYMLPALAAGVPMALLGGLGGDRNVGLGILGAAGLGGLAYGIARSNNWKGWEPVENMANTMNGWFGMGGQQQTQQQTQTQPKTQQTTAQAPAQTAQPAQTTAPQTTAPQTNQAPDPKQTASFNNPQFRSKSNYTTPGVNPGAGTRATTWA